MKNINWRQVGDLAIGVVKVIAGCTVFMLLPSIIVGDDVYEDDCYGGTYDEAVRAISRSDMFSSHKREVIAILKRHEESSYYKAVIAIVEDDMFSSHKVDTIKSIS